MKVQIRRFVQSIVIVVSLFAIAASHTECEGDGTPLFLSLKEIHARLAQIEKAVCHHYALSGDPLPAFCPTLSPCDEPLKVGPCEALIPRWYYDDETGQCERFEWGGCEPNGNNFTTRAACEAECVPCEVECKPHQECQQYERCGSADDCEVFDYCVDTCRGVECGKGEVCELQEVQCVTEPCPPVAVCVPEEPVDPCALIDCKPGWVCEEQDVVCVTEPCPPIGVCVPEVPEDPCALIDCAPGRVCVEQKVYCLQSYDCEPDPVSGMTVCEALPCPSSPIGVCVPEVEISPCALVRCAAGTSCHEVQPQCFAEPCKPVAMCLPDAATTCDDVPCGLDASCELLQVVCVTEPCYPVPRCVSD